MKVTVARARKYLVELTTRRQFVYRIQNRDCTYLDVEGKKPSYDFKAAQTSIRSIEAMIRAVEHIIRVSDVTEVIEEYGETVDYVVSKLFHAKRRLKVLDRMRMLPATDVETIDGTMCCRKLNFSAIAADASYCQLQREIHEMQLALGKADAENMVEIPDTIEEVASYV